MIDVLRLAGAFGIVIFHVRAPGAWLGYAALPLFIALSAALTTELPQARRRAGQLLTLWIVWGGAYAVMKMGQAVANDLPIASEFEPWMLATGPAIHLWFLPYMAAGVLATSLVRTIAGPGGLTWSGLAICATGLCVMAASGVPKGAPFSQWIFGLPAMGAGMVLAARGVGKLAFRMVSLVAMLALAALLLPPATGAAQTLVAVLALLVAFRFPARSSRWTTQLAAFALGIYLVHPAVVAVLHQVSPTIGWLATAEGAALVIFLSFTVIWIASRHATARRYVLA